MFNCVINNLVSALFTWDGWPSQQPAEQNYSRSKEIVDCLMLTSYNCPRTWNTSFPQYCCYALLLQTASVLIFHYNHGNLEKTVSAETPKQLVQFFEPASLEVSEVKLAQAYSVTELRHTGTASLAATSRLTTQAILDLMCPESPSPSWNYRRVSSVHRAAGNTSLQVFLS